MKKVVLTLAVVLVVAASASADIINVGTHGSIYTGFTRGFRYTAPVAHTITNLDLPREGYVTGALASYLIGLNDGSGWKDALYSMGNAGAIAANIPVNTGDEVLVLGNWTSGTPGSFTAINAYAAETSPYASSVLGQPISLIRSGFQYDIGAGTASAAGALFSTSGSFGRILVTAVPEPAALALLAIGGLAMLRRR